MSIINVIKAIFGSKYERDLELITPYIHKINEECIRLQSLSHDALRHETEKLKLKIQDYIKDYKQKYASSKMSLRDNIAADKNTIQTIKLTIEKNKEALYKVTEEILLQILPTSFAIVKETARRFTENDCIEVTTTEFDKMLNGKRDYIHVSDNKTTWKTTWDVMGNNIKWNMIHFDEQLIGGVVLHQGKIAEMATGEGKTLVSTLPVFLNALSGNGVHVITVNDYLAKRDYMWNRPIFEFHGLSVACIDDTEPISEERKKAYAADITYGTNHEFGFDYLRDNTAITEYGLVQREHNYAIIDEIDSILIDDARTPLILSREAKDDNTQDYITLQPLVQKLVIEQTTLIQQYLVNAKENIKKNIKDEETGLNLYRAFRGYPKYKPLVQFLSEPGNKVFLTKSEEIYLENNNERMSEVDEGLLFTIDEKNNLANLTDKGIDRMNKLCNDENFFILSEVTEKIDNIDKDNSINEEDKYAKKKLIFNDCNIKARRIHVVKQLLKAYTLFEKLTDYLVDNGKVLIIDEQTGRILHGRRYSDGLHQAIEAKEQVKVEKNSQTDATITLQNYFKMYHKLSGMTGTAITEANEFYNVYNLDVITIPTHKKMIREDKGDVIYKTIDIKFKAIIDQIIAFSKAGRPVLVGTTSVQNSEILSRMLEFRKIKHQVLNAKFNQRESEIISHAGESGTVTIATNMAGRGTDIKLDEKALKAGGLAIIGSEKHESRRIDRQLRGRAGRQGDPGSSQFFISFEDNLMRRALGDNKVQMFIDKFDDDEILDGSLVNIAIEGAQKKIEENNSYYRRRLLEYDNVLNIQRKYIYKQRHKALKGEMTLTDIYDIFLQSIDMFLLKDRTKEIEYRNLEKKYNTITNAQIPISYYDFGNDTYEEIKGILYKDLIAKYNTICENIYNSVFKDGTMHQNVIKVKHNNIIFDIHIDLTTDNNKSTLEKGRIIFLKVISKVMIMYIDTYWQQHLSKMTKLKQSSQNAYYEQRDPLTVYKFEAYKLFNTMITNINKDIIEFIFKYQIINSDNTDQESNEEILSLQNKILEQIRKRHVKIGG